MDREGGESDRFLIAANTSYSFVIRVHAASNDAVPGIEQAYYEFK